MMERTFLLRPQQYVFDGPATSYWERGLNQTLPPAPDEPKAAPIVDKRVTRLCPVCHADKLVSAFGRSIGHRDGLHRECRQCRRTKAQKLWIQRAKERGTPLYVIKGMGCRVKKWCPELMPPQMPPQMPPSDDGNTRSPAPAIAHDCITGPEHTQVAQHIRPPMRPPFVLDWQQRMSRYQFDGGEVQKPRRRTGGSHRRIKTLMPVQLNGGVFRGGRTVASEINPKKQHTNPFK